MISKILIRNFRSLEHVEVDAGDITTFVGENDAGKSNVLRALNLFFNGVTDPHTPYNHSQDFCQFAKVGSNKAAEVVIRITFDLPLSYHQEGTSQAVWQKVWRANGEHRDGGWRALKGLEPTRRRPREGEQGGFPPYSKIPSLLDKISYHYVPAIKDRGYFSSLQGEMYRALQTVAAADVRNSAAQFETAIRQQTAELLADLNDVLHQDTSLQLPVDLRMVFESLDFSAAGVPFFRRGDGIKVRHIPSILKFIADKNNSVTGRSNAKHIWGFEEPENNVEFIRAFELRNQFLEYAKGGIQIFLTTHSPVFYDMGVSENGVRVRQYSVVPSQDQRGSLIEQADTAKAHALVGFLPLVSPLVLDAKKQWESEKLILKAEKARLQERAQERPTIFVEGPTDELVISRAIAIFFPEHQHAVKVYSGADGNSCSAHSAAARGRAWHLRQQHTTNSLKAFVLLDSDADGVRAAATVTQELSGVKISRQYVAVAHIEGAQSHQQILASGIELPTDLEASFSDELWEVARENGWLEPRDDWGGYIRQDIAQRSLVTGGDFFEGWTASQLLRRDCRVSNAGKQELRAYINGLNDADFRYHLRALHGLLERVLNFILGTLARQV